MEVYGVSAVAQRFVVFKVRGVPIPTGHEEGTGNNPRFCAPLHASLAGAGPPLHVDPQGPPPQATQLTVADHPLCVTLPSDVNSIVKHPLVPVTIPGLVVPV